MSARITVSNGRQFFRIPINQITDARARGFYRPTEMGRTIVSDGKMILEIPIGDLQSAIGDGFRDVLVPENRPQQDAQLVEPVVTPAVATVDVKPASDADSETVSQYRKEELEHETRHEELIANAENATWYGKLPALLHLAWFERRDAVFGQFRTSGLSIALHIAILLLLSTIIFVDDQISDPDVITVSTAVDDSIEEVIIEPVEIEVNEPVEEVEEVAESMDVESEVTEQFVSVDVTDGFDGSLLAAPSSSEGDGDKMEKPVKAKLQFFGSKTEAINFVFVIDNSNSMTRGRFETALNELVKAVNKLSRRQKFFVIFYSDTAYPLFHPYPPKMLVPATAKNKQLLSQWLQTVPLCLKTNGREALQLGLSLKPDVMFVLGDGAFTDGASRHFSANPDPKVVVHTLGMEVSPKNAESFKKLATAHRGTYKDVGVHPQAAALAKQFPRPRNNTRNGIWGLKLPVNKKK